MKKHQFKLISSDGALLVDTLERDSYPLVGEGLTVLNFPVVERYIIERLMPRSGHWAHDRVERMALVIRKDKVLQTATSRDNVIAFNPDVQIVTRLAKIEKIARQAITAQLTLRICHTDFVALCETSGLSGDVSDFDILAYHDIPMCVGEAGAEWNASTAFEGYSDDIHVLYVTLPGGAPFVMNPTLFETAKAFYSRQLSVDQAMALAVAAAVGMGAVESEALINGLREMFRLIEEGIMPIYDAAQEMTRMPARLERLERRESVRLH